MALNVNPPLRTAKQIIDPDGTPHSSVLTSNLWVGSPTVFSNPTEGNKVTPFVTGKDYFANLIAACDAAQTEVCILGWQVNWDALLAPGDRLFDVLLRAAKRGVKVFVMPWDDSNPVQTYDDQTKAVLESINDHPEVKKKLVQVLLTASVAEKNSLYFSHHQKQVIIDRKTAFVGGIDVAYGRFDDATFDLQADKDGRQVLNRYNGCVAWIQKLNWAKDNLVNPDLMTGAIDSYYRTTSLSKTNAEQEVAKVARGGWQAPYADAGSFTIASNRNWGIKNQANSAHRLETNTPDLHTLDPKIQPRMPWQDIHSRIEGPAVSDLMRNFVLRWNASGGKRMEMPQPAATYDKAGGTFVQVLRSAPAAMGQAEYKARLLKAGVKAPAGTENDIHRAYVQLIEKSRYFIYIENQFFVSAFGHIGGPVGELSPAAQFINTYGGGDQNHTAVSTLRPADDDSHVKTSVKGRGVKFTLDDSDLYKLPSNQICEALVARIQRAILDAGKPKFHVYITLPVHPEGMLGKAAIAVQVYWTMQTLVFGSKSLLNGIRRALKARELMDKDAAEHVSRDHSAITNDAANSDYESVPVEKCFEYVTLLNLRNWAKLPGTKPGDERYVTEQIYVHTKLLIVDDLYALYGSANINDRSMLGERDSEIAVLVMDGDASRADTCGKGSQRPVRAFAHNLRMDIWKKLFGITGKVRPADHLLSAIEAPGIPDSWRRIQAQAQKNAAAYEAVFAFVPRNSVTSPTTRKVFAARIIPTWDIDASVPQGAQWRSGNITSPMPFQPEFWSAPQYDSTAVGQLNGIRGFISALPIHWTKDENLKFAYPTALVADNDAIETDTPNQAVAGSTRLGQAPTSIEAIEPKEAA